MLLSGFYPATVLRDALIALLLATLIAGCSTATRRRPTCGATSCRHWRRAVAASPSISSAWAIRTNSTIRDRTASHDDWSTVRDGARDAWRRLIGHNRSDLEGMAHVIDRASGHTRDLPSQSHIDV